MSRRKYSQGTFVPKNPQKCVNRGPVRYLSSYEFKFMTWCDSSSRVVRWGSENVIIPYESPVDGKIHRYYVDNWVVIRDDTGKETKYLVEIKPSTQTIPPVAGKKRRKTVLYETLTWEVNQAKWKAATEFCTTHGFKFALLTEKHLESMLENIVKGPL